MKTTPEMQVREADSCEAIGRYLARNPGLSSAAWDEDQLVGFAMCGHDGRRGYFQHVSWRRLIEGKASRTRWLLGAWMGWQRSES